MEKQNKKTYRVMKENLPCGFILCYETLSLEDAEKKCIELGTGKHFITINFHV